MNKYFNWYTAIKRNWPIVCMTLLSLVLFITNYKIGTYLLGWDTTAPELNLSLNLERFVGGVWQEYRGMGTLDGMAHTANIVHWLWTALLRLLLGESLVRYVSLLLLHLLGGIGIYKLLNDLLIPRLLGYLQYHHKPSPLTLSLLSLVGGLLYQYHFMTIQMFYTPLEVFAIHFAALPWIIWSLLRYLQSHTKRDLLLFAVVLFISSGQAHVPTIFLSLGILLATVGGVYLLTDVRRHFKPLLWLVLVAIGVQSFWGLPYVYSATHKAGEISNTKINQFSTSDIFFRNHAWGDIQSVATMGSFNIDYTDWTGSQFQSGPLLQQWSDHYHTTIFQLSAWLLFCFTLLSVALLWKVTRRSKDWLFLSILVSWLLFFSLLGTNIPILGLISFVLRTFVPFFFDIFRFTFTKFSLIYVFLSAIVLSLGLLLMATQLQRLRMARGIQFYIVTSVCLLCLFWTAFPAFLGRFFYPNEKVNLPADYSQVAQYLSQQPVTDRVLILPFTNFYGWTNNQWGHRGSGFFWQMIPQAQVDRAFDAWSSTNETAYTQLNRALNEGEIEQFNQLLSLYRINWILLDTSIYNLDGAAAITSQQLEVILADTNQYVPQYQGKTLKLYKINQTQPVSEVATPVQHQSLSRPLWNPTLDHVPTYSSTEGISRPFSFLSQETITQPLTITDQGLQLHTTVDTSKQLVVPEFTDTYQVVTNQVVAYWTATGLKVEIQPLLPKITINNRLIEAQPSVTEFPDLDRGQYYLVINQDSIIPIDGKQDRSVTVSIQSRVDDPVSISLFPSQPTSTIDMTKTFSNQAVSDCWKDALRDWKVRKNQNLALTSINASACVSVAADFQREQLMNDNVLFGVDTEYKSSDGASPSVCIRKENTFNCLNKDITDLFGNKVDWQSVTLLTALKSDTTYVVDLVNKITQPNQLQTTEFGTTAFITFTPLATLEVPLLDSIINYQQQLTSISTNGNSDITFTIPLGENKQAIITEDWSRNRGNPLAVNCSIYGTGVVNRSNATDGRTYTAQYKGSICDNFTYSDVTVDQEYLFHLQGTNPSGVGMKGFITAGDAKHQLDFTTISRTFNFYSPFLPTAVDDDAVVDLYLHGTSYGSEKNKITIQHLEFIPLPLRWLSQIEVRPTQPQTIPVYRGDRVVRHTTYWYSLSDTLPSNTLVSIDQAFDSGWIAFPSWKFWQQYPHVLFNGWANGWQVHQLTHAGETKLGSLESSSSPISITILYWPQLLSLIGYIAGVITFSILLKLWRAEKKQQALLLYRLTGKLQSIHSKARSSLFGRQ